jgi:Sec-independent protein translocase protein TatA
VVIIVLLLLVIFGPGKAISMVSMARDLGRLVSGAQNTVEEFKSELASSEEVKEARRTAEEFKGELGSARRSVDEEFKKGKLISGEDQNEPAASAPHPEDKDKEVREWEEGKEPSPKERGSPSSSS